VKTFVNAIMYLHSAQQFFKKPNITGSAAHTNYKILSSTGNFCELQNTDRATGRGESSRIQAC
jgi:hypothetical protein